MTKDRKHIRSAWKQRSTADSANHTQCTKKQNSRWQRSGRHEWRENSEKGWFKGLKAEFKKIIWPDKLTLAKRQ